MLSEATRACEEGRGRSALVAGLPPTPPAAYIQVDTQQPPPPRHRHRYSHRHRHRHRFSPRYGHRQSTIVTAANSDKQCSRRAGGGVQWALRCPAAHRAAWGPAQLAHTADRDRRDRGTTRKRRRRSGGNGRRRRNVQDIMHCGGEECGKRGGESDSIEE